MSAGSAEPPPGGSSQRGAVLALVFGGPIFFAAVRAWLEWEDGRHPPNPAFALSPLPVSSSAWALFMPWLLAAVVLVLMAGWLRLWGKRGGARAVQRVLLVVWALLWLGGAGALCVVRANTEQLMPLPMAKARVLGLRPLAPSPHQLGGSEVVLEMANLAGPQRVRVTDERAAHWQPGLRLRVEWAHGRFYGRYLTGWDAREPASAAQ